MLDPAGAATVTLRLPSGGPISAFTIISVQSGGLLGSVIVVGPRLLTPI